MMVEEPEAAKPLPVKHGSVLSLLLRTDFTRAPGSSRNSTCCLWSRLARLCSESHQREALWEDWWRSWVGGYLEAVPDSLTDFGVASMKTFDLFEFPLFAAIHMQQKELHFPRLPVAWVVTRANAEVLLQANAPLRPKGHCQRDRWAMPQKD